MVFILVLIASGIVVGAFAASRPSLRTIFAAAGRAQQFGTIVLLFVMGLWLGGNEDFWQNIHTLGLQGLLFAVAAVAGSVLCVQLFARLAFRKGDQA